MNAFKQGYANRISSYNSYNIKQANFLYPALAIGAPLAAGAGLGALLAEKGEALPGAAIGALRAGVLPIGGLAGSVPGVFAGSAAGAIPGLLSGDPIEAGVLTVVGSGLGRLAGGLGGAYGAHKLLNAAIGEERLNRIFGK